jgi:hypothetical protein
VPPLHGAPLFKSIDEFYRTVMAEIKLLGEGSDRRTGISRQTLYRKEKLVLPGLDPLRTGDFFAEVQEFADTPAEFRKLAIAGCRNIPVKYFRLRIVFSRRHPEKSSGMHRITI